MVSLSTGLTLGLIGAAILGFYKLGGASGIGSRLGGGFSDLFDSFVSSLNPVQTAIDKNNAENPALNPILVAQARFEENEDWLEELEDRLVILEEKIEKLTATIERTKL